MDRRTFPCTNCGAENSCPESFALAHAGRRVTRWCESCRQPFDVELSATATLGHLLFGKLKQPPPSESDWRALVRAIAAGNAAALYALTARMHGIVFPLMLKMSGAWEIAERLTLGTFYDVWRRAARYDPEAASVIGWILKHARSRAMNHHHLRLRWPHRRPAEAQVAQTIDHLLPLTAELWERMARVIGAEAFSVMAPPPEPAASSDWQEAGRGISYKVLARNAEREHVSMLVRLAPGAAYPPHTHAGLEELYLLDGELWIDSKQVHPGGYNRADAGSSDQRVWSETGCTCVLLTSTADILR